MALRVSGWFDQDKPVTLYDFGTLQSLSLGHLSVPWLDARRGQWTNPSGPPMLFFVLPWKAWHREFALVHPNGTTYQVNKLPRSSVGGEGDGFEAWAIGTPGEEFWLVDLNTYLRSPSWETYLIWMDSDWTEAPGITPLVPFRIYLDTAEEGHRFTVHSRASGGPEMASSVVAEDGSLIFSVGTGMEFWITRDADAASSTASNRRRYRA